MQHNIDISRIVGSGPHGRIVLRDVEQYLCSMNVHNSSHIVKNTGLSGDAKNSAFEINTQCTRHDKNAELEISQTRWVIADRLVACKQQVPHFYLSITCVADKLLDFRAEINSILQNDELVEKVTINDLIIKASAIAVSQYPEINVMWCENKIICHNSVDVSVAVSIDDGVITPVVKNADKKSIKEIAIETKDFANRARAKRLLLAECSGGSFTISNLGMYDIDSFMAIINPPQAFILSIGCIKKAAAVSDENKVEIRNIMQVSVSCDHRVVDGVLVSKFLNAFKNIIESPIKMTTFWIDSI